jgi:hypothetical protein
MGNRPRQIRIIGIIRASAGTRRQFFSSGLHHFGTSPLNECSTDKLNTMWPEQRDQRIILRSDRRYPRDVLYVPSTFRAQLRCNETWIGDRGLD